MARPDPDAESFETRPDPEGRGAHAACMPRGTLTRKVAKMLRTVVLVMLSLCAVEAGAQALAPQDGRGAMSANFTSVRSWLGTLYSEEEMRGLQAGSLAVMPYACSCPEHYPYRMVVFATPRGALVSRPEGSESSINF